MVAAGGCDVEGETEEEEEEKEGAKTETSTEAIFLSSQELAMVLGKLGESRTKTSEVERRPRIRVLERSSVWRMGPSESALPVVIVPSSAQ